MDGAPKKKRGKTTGYLMFTCQERKRLASGMKPSETMKELGVRWQALTEEQRKGWSAKALAENQAGERKQRKEEKKRKKAAAAAVAAEAEAEAAAATGVAVATGEDGREEEGQGQEEGQGHVSGSNWLLGFSGGGDHASRGAQAPKAGTLIGRGAHKGVGGGG